MSGTVETSSTGYVNKVRILYWVLLTFTLLVPNVIIGQAIGIKRSQFSLRNGKSFGIPPHLQNVRNLWATPPRGINRQTKFVDVRGETAGSFIKNWNDLQLKNQLARSFWQPQLKINFIKNNTERLILVNSGIPVPPNHCVADIEINVNSITYLPWTHFPNDIRGTLKTKYTLYADLLGGREQEIQGNKNYFFNKTIKEININHSLSFNVKFIPMREKDIWKIFNKVKEETIKMDLNLYQKYEKKLKNLGR